MAVAVRPGIELLVEQAADLLGRRSVALLSNASAVSSDLRSSVDLLHGVVNLVCLIAPEHGLSASAGAGEKIGDTQDPRTGLKVWSLYGTTRRPSAEMLADVDVIVCDLQDVGARFYTYVSTICHVLEAAAELGREVIVTDRPNPLGGLRTEGPPLEMSLASFVGVAPVPIRHGLTMGELARYCNQRVLPRPAQLTIVPCERWRRSMTWPRTSLAWVSPSPNLPSYESARAYPGTCLIEGTNLSEGRGTPLPFQIAGAPWVDGHALAEQLNARHLPGVLWRPHGFTPTQSKFNGQLCQGVQLHVMDEGVFEPVRAGLELIAAARDQRPREFAWKEAAFDRLVGRAAVRPAIDAGESIEVVTKSWADVLEQYAREAASWWIYDR